MQELVTVEQAERVIRAAAVALPAAGLVIGAAAGALRRQAVRGVVLGLLCGASGPAILGPGTGLTFDDCLQSVFVTDGNQTAILFYKYPCSFKPAGCCPAKPVFYYGLGMMDSACKPDFKLSGQTTRARYPCNVIPPVCAITPGYTGGPPYVGNANFKLRFTQGPNPAGYAHAALLMINWGNQCKAQRFKMPCGELIHLYPVINPWFWSAVVPTVAVGAPPCGLTGTFPLPIPVMPALCCFKFCGQWAALNALYIRHAPDDGDAAPRAQYPHHLLRRDGARPVLQGS